MIKKILFVVAFLLVLSNLNAQNEFKKKGILGGEISGTIESRGKSFTLQNYIAYHFSPKWTAGLLIQYFRSNIAYARPIGSDPILDTGLGFGILTRYHVNPKQKFIFLIESSALKYSNKREEFRKDGTKIWKNAYISFNITPKISYTVGKWNLLISLGNIGYRKKLYDDKNTKRKYVKFSSQFGIRNLGFGVELEL